MKKFEITFNAAQLEAINAPDDKPILCLAGPGAGKTLVLIHRAAKLIEKGVDPRRMLLTTFTRKAAQEIGKRLAILVGPKVADQVFISTIHGLCFYLLKKHDERRNVMSQGTIKKLIGTVLGYDHLDWEVGWRSVYSYINSARIFGCRYPHEVERFYLETFSFRDQYEASRLAARLTTVFDFFQENKPGIDFVDMIMLVWHLLREDHEFSVRSQERFTHIFIDELQDTSLREFEILRELAKPQDKVFGVGDPDQELYRWNGADPYHNIFGFPKEYPGTKIIKLEVNYRSTKEIISAANNLIHHNYNEDDELMKVLLPRPKAEDGEKISYKTCDTIEEEAYWVVGEIQHLIAQHWEPGQIFVIMRTNAQSRAIEDTLARVKIPYITLGKVGFYGRKHIKDVLAYIALAQDERDDDVFKRVANIASSDHPTHFRGFGKSFLRTCSEEGPYLWYGMQKLAREFDALGLSKDVTKFKRSGISDFVKVITTLQTVKEPDMAVRLARKLCYDSWYLRSEGFSSADEAEGSVLNDLDELEYAAHEFVTIPEFLEHARILQDAQEEKDEANVVVLTTIHKAKGLERDIVFLIGFSNRLLPHAYAMGLIDVETSELPVMRVSDIRDERCAAFVATSRAKKKVYISSLRSYRGQILEPSMFLSEILGEEVKGEREE